MAKIIENTDRWRIDRYEDPLALYIQDKVIGDVIILQFDEALSWWTEYELRSSLFTEPESPDYDLTWDEVLSDINKGVLDGK